MVAGFLWALKGFFVPHTHELSAPRPWPRTGSATAPTGSPPWPSSSAPSGSCSASRWQTRSVGILISIAIFVLLWGTVRSLGGRLLDGVEPELVDRAEQALALIPGVLGVAPVQLRWIGHRLHRSALVRVGPDTAAAQADAVRAEATHALGHALPNLEDAAVATAAAARA